MVGQQDEKHELDSLSGIGLLERGGPAFARGELTGFDVDRSGASTRGRTCSRQLLLVPMSARELKTLSWDASLSLLTADWSSFF